MRIKKTSQYIEGGASLSNVYGTSNKNGYTQEYLNTQLGKVLWTNQNPTSDVLNGSQFVLSSSDYDYLEIVYNISTDGTSFTFNTGKLPKGKGTVLSIITSGATTFSGLQRNITYVNDTTLQSGTPYSFDNTSRTTNASVMIPILIIGYKSTSTLSSQNTRSIPSENEIEEPIEEEDNR